MTTILDVGKKYLQFMDEYTEIVSELKLPRRTPSEMVLFGAENRQQGLMASLINVLILKEVEIDTLKARVEKLELQINAPI